MKTCLLSLALFVPAAGCGGLYYDAMESFGYAKRDLLVSRVEAGRESQQEAKEQFQSTFDAFKALTGFDGGELESRYRDLKSEYDRSKDASDDVSERIRSIDKVATAMFEEWGEELEQIQSPDARRKSEQLRADSQQNYDKLIGAMRAAEGRMQPVLTAFNDQVLVLKHNLNAAAVNSLKGDVAKIESDVGNLIEEMQKSIQEADDFIARMGG